jgi:hypothetical protein
MTERKAKGNNQYGVFRFTQVTAKNEQRQQQRNEQALEQAEEEQGQRQSKRKCRVSTPPRKGCGSGRDDAEVVALE